jgi:hypothetical protein
VATRRSAPTAASTRNTTEAARTCAALNARTSGAGSATASTFRVAIRSTWRVTLVNRKHVHHCNRRELFTLCESMASEHMQRARLLSECNLLPNRQLLFISSAHLPQSYCATRSVQVCLRVNDCKILQGFARTRTANDKSVPFDQSTNSTATGCDRFHSFLCLRLVRH